MRQPDILEQIYRAAVIDGLSLNEIRAAHGGQRVYIPAQPTRDRQRIAAELRTHPMAEVCKRHGISRVTAWRLRKLG